MDDKRAFITCSMEPELKEKFERAAKDDKRYPAQQLRLLVEEYVASKSKLRRQLAPAAK